MLKNVVENDLELFICENGCRSADHCSVIADR